MKGQIALAVLLLAAPGVRAEDYDVCAGVKPRFLRNADFGHIEVGSPARCADNPNDIEGGCEFVRGGITYGVTRGYIVSKEIKKGAYSGEMPFNLSWGDDLAAVEHRVAAITRGTIRFKVGFAYGTHNPVLASEGGYCLVTRRGRYQYFMEIVFDEYSKLVEIKASAPFD